MFVARKDYRHPFVLVLEAFGILAVICLIRIFKKV
jgi:hypothetical protein